MKKVKRILMLLLVMTLTIVLGGCQDEKDGNKESQKDSSSQETQGEPTMGGSIVVGIPQDLEDSLDPHKSVAAGTKEVLFNIYEGLVKPDEQGNYTDAVAQSHEISEDGKVYTFALRQNVKFHDGTTVTAEDVKYSIERCAGISEGTTPLVAAFSNVEKVEIPDAQTVAITLKEPDTEFLAYLTVAIVPQHAADLDKNPVGTGPFRYVSRSPQENIVIEKFTDYWDSEHQAYLDKVTFKIAGDINAIVTGLKSGSIDMYPRINSTQSAQLAEDEDLTIYEGGMNLIQALYLNNKEKPFDDVKVRQALCYAVNRQEVLDMMADGKGTIIGSSMFPAFEKYYMPELADKYPQDIEKAKQLAAETGIEGSTMTLYFNSERAYMKESAQVIQQQLKNVGINLEVIPLESTGFFEKVFGTDGDYEFYLNGYAAVGDPDTVVAGMYDGTWGVNLAVSDELLGLWQEARSVFTEDERAAIYKEIQEKTKEEMSCYPIAYPNYVFVTTGNVKGTDTIKRTPIFEDYTKLTIE